MRLLAILLSLVLTACGSTYSTLQTEGSANQTIFTVPEDLAFQIAYGSITKVFPGYEIAEVDGPLRGYTTTFRFVLDTYTQQVMVIPSTGRASDGRTVKGYYFEVSGRGSSIVQGRAKNAELFDEVSRAAQASGKGTVVSELSRSTYVGAKWKQGDQRAVNPTSSGSDVLTQIERLKQLRDSGAITDEEFNAKRKQLLDRL